MTEHEMLELILQKITGLEDKVTGLENKVTGLEDRMTGFEDRMTGFEDRMTGLENKVTGLEDGQQNILQQIDEKITASEERMQRKRKEILLRCIRRWYRTYTSPRQHGSRSCFLRYDRYTWTYAF